MPWRFSWRKTCRTCEEVSLKNIYIHIVSAEELFSHRLALFYLFKCFRVEEYVKEGLDKKVIGPESGANGAETAYAGERGCIEKYYRSQLGC